MGDRANDPTVTDEPRVRFNRFRIEEVLGSDGMGTVEKAFDTVLRVTVALKTIRPDLAQSNPAEYAELRERFRREAIAGAQLRGEPHLVNVYELSAAADTLYLVQEYVAGGDLRPLIKRRGRLPVGRALEIAADAAMGLGAMHNHGLVHRDVKPGNIFLTLDGTAKVGDFGIVQDGMTQRAGGSLHGHPYTGAYASPEQMTSTGYLTPASDQYSLGLVLFEMLTGRRYRDFSPEGARQLLAAVPPGVVAIFNRMIQDDPDNRYPDMQAVNDAMNNAESGTPSQPTTPLSPVATLPPVPFANDPLTRPLPSGPPGAPPTPTPQPWQPQPEPLPQTPMPPPRPPVAETHSRRGVLIGGAVVLLGAVGGGTAYARSKNGGGGTTVTVVPTPAPPTAGAPTLAVAVLPTLVPSPAPTAVPPTPLPPTALPPTPVPPTAVPPTPLPPTMPPPPTPVPPTAVPPTPLPPPPPTATSAPPPPPPPPMARTITAMPLSGSLVTKNAAIAYEKVGVMTRDATIGATFRNPPGNKQWSYGLEFRETDKVLSRLFLTSSGAWRKQFVSTDASGKFIRDSRREQGGSAEPLNLNANETNDVQIVLTNRVGELFVNKTRVTSFNFGENLEPGDVYVATGFFSDDAVGLTVPYSNLTVANPPPAPSAKAQQADLALYGPASGVLRFNPSASTIPSVSTLVAATNAIVSARFINPYAASRKGWDYGLTFRLSNTKQYRLLLTSDKGWTLSYVAKAASDNVFPLSGVTEVDKGTVTALRVNDKDSNDVVLQFMGATGTLRVNGLKIKDLDLGANTDEGTVQILSGTADSTQIAGESTHYEDFTIAPL